MAQTTTLGEQRGRPRGEPFGKASRKAGSFSGTPDLSKLQMAPRESIGGEHGLDGEDSVYKGAISIAGFGGTRILYLKFFFWKKGDPHGEQGIEVQSFKLWSPKNV